MSTIKRKLTCVQEQLASSRKKIKLLFQARRRLVKRNARLKDVIAELRKQELMGTDSLSVLEKIAGAVSDLIVRHINKEQRKPLPKSYSAELRSFTLTLHFYSPHAYK